MYLLPGNPSLNAVEAYRDSGEGQCANRLQHLPGPFTVVTMRRETGVAAGWRSSTVQAPAAHGVLLNWETT